MRSSDTATRIVLRSENGWMAEQIDLRVIEHLFLTHTGHSPRVARTLWAVGLRSPVPAAPLSHCPISALSSTGGIRVMNWSRP